MTILRDRAYLDYLRTQPCILTGFPGSEYEAIDPCHLGTAGEGVKSPDNWALPIRHSLHVEGHNSGEISMLRKHAPDWLIRAAFRALAEKDYHSWKVAND